DRNRSHWSTSKTPSYTKSVSWQHHPVSIPITASYYVYDTNKVKSGALEATALINVKYD
ncbi:fimbrial protein, partial [Escherichia coli]|uniref:fimbrial protein n=1 Tax=Escherichia coli TaxID=562 RepID=UPI00313F1D42